MQNQGVTGQEDSPSLLWINLGIFLEHSTIVRILRIRAKNTVFVDFCKPSPKPLLIYGISSPTIYNKKIT
jgi:hypothetical protein